MAYLRTFERLGLKAIPMQADTGPIGGDMSHEFVILAETGESEVACHRDFLEMSLNDAGLNYGSDLQSQVDQYTSKYAATDEQRDPEQEKALGDDLLVARGIEVGHIFNFGTKYSKAMNAVVNGPNGEEVAVEMGSYGIGVSRLIGAIIEASHDDDGIIWPESVAPFKVGVINLKVGDDACDQAAKDFYQSLADSGISVLYDDRDSRAGMKFADMDLIGLPWQVVIGPRGLKNGAVELKQRSSGEKSEISLESVLSKLTG